MLLNSKILKLYDGFITWEWVNDGLEADKSVGIRSDTSQAPIPKPKPKQQQGLEELFDHRHDMNRKSKDSLIINTTCQRKPKKGQNILLSQDDLLLMSSNI